MAKSKIKFKGYNFIRREEQVREQARIRVAIFFNDKYVVNLINKRNNKQRQ